MYKACTGGVKGCPGKVVQILDWQGKNLYNPPMIQRDSSVPQYPMRVVVRRTGLNASLLRAWERRYGAVDPGRSGGGQRLYSEDDIRKLALLREAVDAGHNISSVAELSLEGLRDLVLREQARTLPQGAARGRPRDNGEPMGSSGNGGGRFRAEEGPPPTEATSTALPGARSRVRAAELLARALEAVHGMDTRALESVLNRSAMALAPDELVDDLLVPLLGRIGLLWREGEVGPASEHMASAVIRRFLDWLLEALGSHDPGPLMIVGTPAGHRHEFGALLAAVVSAAEGWDVLSLGPDLPASEIAEAVRRKGASAVALSAIHPAHDPHLPGELRALRRELTGDVRVLVGGPAALAHHQSLEEVGVEVLSDFPEMRKLLRAAARRDEPDDGAQGAHGSAGARPRASGASGMLDSSPM
jgi:DNA-binding transcriptional MerR regulator/methylmalonyl-CoA mutase cobalamin-binding subunit